MFSILIADTEEHLRERGLSGILVNQVVVSILLLAFADDIGFVAESAEIQSLLNESFVYCAQNRLTVTASKTKVVVFEKVAEALEIKYS